MNSNNDYFKTNMLHYAAIIETAGIAKEIPELREIVGKSVYLVYSNLHECEQAIEEAKQGKLKLNPINFFSYYRDLLSRIKSFTYQLNY